MKVLTPSTTEAKYEHSDNSAGEDSGPGSDSARKGPAGRAGEERPSAVASTLWGLRRRCPSLGLYVAYALQCANLGLRRLLLQHGRPNERADHQNNTADL